MFSEHSNPGKILVVLGYLLAVFLFLIALVFTAALLAIFVDGKDFGGRTLKTFDYIVGLLELLWLWTSSVASLVLTRDLRRFGNVKRCRWLAGYLCLFIPLGTIFGVLTLVYVRKWGAVPSVPAGGA